MSRVDPVSPQSAVLRRWLSIVGIGEDGIDALSPVARGLISDAEIVVPVASGIWRWRRR